MQTPDSMRVKKPRTEHSSPVQMRYRQKGTLQRMLRSHFDDCHRKGVYLLIHEDNQYFRLILTSPMLRTATFHHETEI
ncbi:hypothetical protein ACJ73_05940 [Blastomyces percursus]|uniref:Uncharacterized protein n=1 Tax=Blastomyces percursus TaxID=1658174 RepID=A0A1J9R2J6_9EURO|nr:hypothetical protein ACJ73_05940 [Blastomyces percursus]